MEGKNKMRVNFSGTIAGSVVVRPGETRNMAVERAQSAVAEALTARAKRYGPVVTGADGKPDVVTGPTVASFVLGDDVPEPEKPASEAAGATEPAMPRVRRRAAKAAE